MQKRLVAGCFCWPDDGSCVAGPDPVLDDDAGKAEAFVEIYPDCDYSYMNMRKIITIAVVLVVAFIFMRSMGLSFGDLADLAKGELTQARSDTKALMSGEYSERMARRMREEAAKMPSGQSGEGIDSELNRELAAERKRIMEERARNAQKIGAEVLRGDVETLKRQVQQNARQAGGAP